MPTDKPLPDSDDDIIDLTDLVEEGSAGKAAPGDDAPVDMSFEQELEDLFGDAGPPPAKPAAPATLEPADDDFVDLAGLEVEAPPQPKANADALGTDEDVVDLAGLGLDDFDDTAASPTAEAAAESVSSDDAMADLFGRAEAGHKSPTADAEADTDAHLSALDFTAPEAAPAAAPPDDENLVPEMPEPAEAEAEAAPTEVNAAEEAMDLSDMTLAEFEPVPEAAEVGTAASEQDAAMADLLGELPEVPELAETTAADIAALTVQPSEQETPEEPTPAAAPEAVAEPEATAEPPASPPPAASPDSATGQATLPLLAAAAGATVGAIDLGALDTLIDAAKGPQPEPQSQEPTEQQGRLDALDKRLESLETATATLFDKIETLPPAADGDALADALSARLEDALSERLEAVLAGLPQAPQLPDAEALKAQILAAVALSASADRDSLLDDVRQAMAPEFAALRGELPSTAELAGKAETAAALEGLHASLARLEALTQGRQTKFEDFAETMEARLAELQRGLPPFENFATTESLAASLVTLGENLSRDIAGKLDERMAELRRDLRETLTTDITASLEERLTEATEAARQAARKEVEALGEVLSERLEALETDRIDPDSLADKVRAALAPALPDAEALARFEAKPSHEALEAAMTALRTDMAAEIQKAVPRAAAAVIREEIAALAKELL